MREQLLALLDEIRPDVEFEKETKLIDDGILDSFDIISIVQEMNDTFGVKIKANELQPDNFNTVDAMIELIEKLKRRA
jgi:acyl carrier protein